MSTGQTLYRMARLWERLSDPRLTDDRLLGTDLDQALVGETTGWDDAWRTRPFDAATVQHAMEALR
jgi:hypothetical protein